MTEAAPTASAAGAAFAVPALVYVVREGRNEELRYSLRSMEANLPHGDVWIVGGGPDWLSDRVRRLPRPQVGGKYEAARGNLRAAVESDATPDRFLLVNDDHFLLRPFSHWPVLHRGPIDPVRRYYASIRSAYYLQGMDNTIALLGRFGVEEPLSYELHMPFWVEKARALETFAVLDEHAAKGPFHFRTLYGNMHALGGEWREDCKVFDLHTVPPWPVASTSDYSFTSGAIGRHIRNLFPRPSSLERRPARAWVGVKPKETVKMAYRYTNKTTGQVIESHTEVPRLDALARWERTEFDGSGVVPEQEPDTGSAGAAADESGEAGAGDGAAADGDGEQENPEGRPDWDAPVEEWLEFARGLGLGVADDATLEQVLDAVVELKTPAGNASTDEWAAFAVFLGVEVGEDDKRADLQDKTAAWASANLAGGAK